MSILRPHVLVSRLIGPLAHPLLAARNAITALATGPFADTTVVKADTTATTADSY